MKFAPLVILLQYRPRHGEHRFTARAELGHQYALHYDSIKRGVQKASKIRVREIQEDYPWIHRVLTPLSGMVVVQRQSR